MSRSVIDLKRVICVLFALVLALLPDTALAQTAVLQGGPTTPGHMPMYAGQRSTQAIVQDSGIAAGGPLGSNPTELGLTTRNPAGTYPAVNVGTGPLFTNLCTYDAAKNNPTGYHYLCLGPNTNNGGMIAYGAGGSAAPQPLSFNINGTSYNFPFLASGIVGPSSSTINDFACWNNITGTLLKDCGPIPITVPSPTASTLGGLFSGIAPVGSFVTGVNTSGVLQYVSPFGTPNTWPAVQTFSATNIFSLNPVLSACNGYVFGNNVALAASCSPTIPSSVFADGNTGTGSIVHATNPTLNSLIVSGTINKVTLTQPATGATLTISDGKTLTANNSLTLAGNDGTTMTFPVASDTVAGLSATQTLLNKTLTTPVLNGIPTGTGVSAAATASTLDLRDANANISGNAFLSGYNTTVTAAGTTTLTVASAEYQFFTGTSTQTTLLPVVSTLALGQQFWIFNNSTGAVQVQSSGGNNILSVANGNLGIFTVISTSGTTAASWSQTYVSSGAGTGTITSLTCGTGLTGGTITLSGTCAISTPISVSLGGSGATTLAANNVLLGNGTSALQTVAPSTSGNALYSNGTTWVSAAPPVPHYTVKTSGTTYTTNANTKFTKVIAIAGGGGGGGSQVNTAGGGGGAGDVCTKTYTTLVGSTGYTYAIGAAGGGGGGGAGSSGATGGNTTFTDGVTLMTAAGGVGGAPNNGAGGTGGSGTNCDFDVPGQNGSLGIGSGTQGFSGNGGSTAYGGGGFGRILLTLTANSNGNPAKNWGGAGSGGYDDALGGNGFTGAIIFEEWY